MTHIVLWYADETQKGVKRRAGLKHDKHRQCSHKIHSRHRIRGMSNSVMKVGLER
jgi:hypothetical protein